jgi:hypothetical protein
MVGVPTSHREDVHQVVEYTTVRGTGVIGVPVA